MSTIIILWALYVGSVVGYDVGKQEETVKEVVEHD